MIFALLVALLIGAGVAFFAVQNTHFITLTIANYAIPGVPLYVVVIGALVLGVIISLVLHLIGSFSSLLETRGKDTALANTERENKVLRQQLQTLRIENARLRGERPAAQNREQVHEDRPRYSFLERF